MSGLVILSGFIYLCRRFPLLMVELVLLIVDLVYRQFLDCQLERDERQLVQCGFKDVSWPYHHCYRRGEVEFYTTTFRLGAESFSGWRVRVRYLPNIYLEVEFGTIWIYCPDFYCDELAQLISKEISFLHLAMLEAQRNRCGNERHLHVKV